MNRFDSPGAGIAGRSSGAGGIDGVGAGGAIGGGPSGAEGGVSGSSPDPTQDGISGLPPFGPPYGDEVPTIDRLSLS